mgnify:CR=1 FL=1
MFRQLRKFFIYGLWVVLATAAPSAVIAQNSDASSLEVSGFNSWIDHLPYNTFSHVEPLDPYVFCASENNLIVIDGNSDEYTRYSRINGLSGTSITALRTDPASQTVWIGYASGRIDVWQNGTFRPIVAIEETPSYTGLKQVNGFAFYNGRAYAATDFGLVEFEIDTRLAQRTLLLGDNYTPIAIESFDLSSDGEVCAFSPNRDDALLMGDLNENLPSWTGIDYAGISGLFGPQHIRWFEVDERFVLAAEDLTSGTLMLGVERDGSGVWQTAAYNGPYSSTNFGNQGIRDISVIGNWLVVSRDFNVLAKKLDQKNTPSDSINISGALFQPGVLAPLAATRIPGQQAFYIGNYQTGIIRVKDGNTVKRILPSSPYSNKAYRLVPYGKGRNNDPNGPSTNPYADPYRGNTGGIIHLPGALTDLWTKAFSSDGVGRYSEQAWSHWPKQTLYGLTDFISAAHRFTETGEQLYLSSWGGGIVELTDGDTTAWFNTTNTDGVLEGVNGNANDLRTGGIAFDDDGNLWGVQSLVSEPLFRRDVDGNWSRVALSPGADAVALKDLVIRDGMIFIQSRTNGMYAYREKDGAALRRQVSTGVGSGNLPSDKVLCMTFDNDGELWIGTDEGLVVLYSPNNVFDGSGNSDARPILFEEDGVVQKLLGDNPITSIFVDGGNRKWIGTRGAGVFLVSPDGLQTIHQFTASNSPLFSNSITDIAVDPTSGEVLIATDQGLIGYRSSATPGYSGTEPELHVYPNPVRPGYDGPVFIQGNTENARIKITDVTGGLVYETLAAGGGARWEGTFLDGNKVPSGVYLIYALDELGEITAQGKVLIVR